MQKQYSRWDVMKYLIHDGWKYSHKMMVLLCVEGIINAIAMMAGAILPAAIIAILAEYQNFQSMMISLTFVFTFYGVLQALSTYMTTRNRFQYIPWRGTYFEKVLKLSMSCDYQKYEQKESLQAYEKAMEGIGNNHLGMEGFMHHITAVMTALLEVIFCLIWISNVSLWMIVALFSISLISYFLQQRFHEQYLKTIDQKAENSIHTDYFSKLPYRTEAGKDIRLYQLQNLLNNQFKRFNHTAVSLEANSEKCRTNANVSAVLIDFLRDVISYGYLMYLVFHGKMNISSFVLYLGLVSTFSEQFIRCGNSILTVQQDLDLSRHILSAFDVLTTKDGEIPFGADEMDIVFDHVTFSYPGSDRKILDDSSLHIKPGEKLALVGLNGAGKTTLVKLLCRFYHPGQGTIYVNGINLEELNQVSYLQAVSVLFQDTKLFSFTIGENVSGKTEGTYDEKAVEKVIVESGLGEKIHSLPDGIHTYVNKDLNENGINLSGGELQKLLLARALYHQPEFLILDEPTAALDALAEQELYEKYQELIGKKSAIFISHRLASTRFCDRIILLENGKIKEEGTHEELMKQNGEYHKLFNVQSKYYQENEGEMENESLVG